MLGPPIPKKWRSYRDHRLYDVTSPYVFLLVVVRNSAGCGVAGSAWSRYGAVSATVERRLRQLGAEVRHVDDASGARRLVPPPPMMWRFTVVDDPDVELFIGRFPGLYIGSNDITASVITIRLPFCGYNLA